MGFSSSTNLAGSLGPVIKADDERTMPHSAVIMTSGKSEEAEMPSDQQFVRLPHDNLYHCSHQKCQPSRGFTLRCQMV
jgi:hypothetical protein